MKRNNYEDSHPSGTQLLLALDGELPLEEAASITQHVERCPECYAQWEQWRRIAERILEYHNVSLQARVPRISAAATPMGTHARRRRSWARVVTAFAGAAAALVYVVWFFARSDRQAPAPQPSPARATALAQASPPVPAVAATEVGSPKHPAVRHRTPQRREDSTVANDRGGFVALPFSDDALPLRDATVVRVQLPVEELRLTGLPVEGEYRGAMIQADVLLGMDGLPRGIRLVQ
jgi:hypothetical protein